MTVSVLNEQEINQEAVQILFEHLSPAKVARLLASWQIGRGDYLAIREQMFSEETVDTLLEKIEEYQAKQKPVT
jgi:hypothetical protein